MTAVGSLIAFVHPVGGFLQLIGWMFLGYSVVAKGTRVAFLFGAVEVGNGSN